MTTFPTSSGPRSAERARRVAVECGANASSGPAAGTPNYPQVSAATSFDP